MKVQTYDPATGAPMPPNAELVGVALLEALANEALKIEQHRNLWSVRVHLDAAHVFIVQVIEVHSINL